MIRMMGLKLAQLNLAARVENGLPMKNRAVILVLMKVIRIVQYWTVRHHFQKHHMTGTRIKLLKV